MWDYISSKPAIGIFEVNGAFDSHTLPPIFFQYLPRNQAGLARCQPFWASRKLRVARRRIISKRKGGLLALRSRHGGSESAENALAGACRTPTESLRCMCSQTALRCRLRIIELSPCWDWLQPR